ncbi:uncharacterized protein METZ01_LOCUS437156, partial [marine metagenome]
MKSTGLNGKIPTTEAEFISQYGL